VYHSRILPHSLSAEIRPDLLRAARKTVPLSHLRRPR